MLGRIANAITTRLAPLIERQVRDEFDRREDHGRKEVRELIHEMEDVLEKFSRVVAREARRRTRDMKAALEEEGGTGGPHEGSQGAQPGIAADQTPDLTPAQRKQLLRQRLAHGGLRLPRTGNAE